MQFLKNTLTALCLFSAIVSAAFAAPPACCASGNCCVKGNCCTVPGCCKADKSCCDPAKGVCTSDCGCKTNGCCTAAKSVKASTGHFVTQGKATVWVAGPAPETGTPRCCTAAACCTK